MLRQNGCHHPHTPYPSLRSHPHGLINLSSELLPDRQKRVSDTGKHTACCEQHEFTMHTKAFDAQLYVVLLQGSKIEQRIPGAQ